MLRNAVFYIAANGLQRGVSLLLLPIVFSRLSVEDYGRHALVASVYALAGPVVSLALFTAIGRMYFDAAEPRRRDRIVATLLLGQFALIAINTPLVFLTMSALGAIGWGQDIRPYLPLALVSGACASLADGVFAFWRSAERGAAVAGTQLASFAATFTVIIYLVVGRDLGLTGLWWGILAGQSMTALVGLACALRDVGFACDVPTFREGLRFSVPLIPLLVGDWLILSSSRWILHYFHGEDAVGTFSFFYVIAGGVALAMYGLADAVGPRFYTAYRDEGAHGAQRCHRRVFPWYCAAATALGVVLVLTDRLWVPIVSRGRVGVSAPLLLAVVLAHLGRALYLPFSFALYAVKRSGEATLLLLTSAVTNVGVSAVLVPRLGVAGAGIAAVAGSAIHVALALVRARRLLALDLLLGYVAIAIGVVVLASWSAHGWG